MAERRTGSFPAQHPDGRVVWIDVYERAVAGLLRVDPADLRRMVTKGGLAVRHRARGEYLIIATGAIVRSDAIDAP